MPGARLYYIFRNNAIAFGQQGGSATMCSIDY